MRIVLSLVLIFIGIVSLMTGVGAFAGILFIAAGIALWVWGVFGSQTDESITEMEPMEKQETIIDPNEDPGRKP